MAHPVTVQPQAQWMAAPRSQSGCPPGLEYLTQVDQLICRQVVEVLQAFTGWETNNKYVITNTMNQQIFYAFEKTDMCMRLCCGPRREFTLHIVNNMNQEVMRIYRPLKFCAGPGNCWYAGCCDCCAQEIEIQAPPGQLIGRIKQVGAGCSYKFEIKNEKGEHVLDIDGPCTCLASCCGACCADIDYPILSRDGREIGAVTKQWSGLLQEMFTVADNFGIRFPMDLDAKMKATLLGATFLIDFMVYERKNNDND